MAENNDDGNINIILISANIPFWYSHAIFSATRLLIITFEKKPKTLHQEYYDNVHFNLLVLHSLYLLSSALIEPGFSTHVLN